MSDRMDKYEPIKILGEGSYGKVYLMRHLVERKLVCVKVIKVKNIPRKEREMCKVEVDLLKRLTHPNIVGYRESFMHRQKDSLCIVMEYCDGGDLCAKIKAQRGKLFPETKILHWFVQMALGLHYMHEERVLHRDLKSQNIFMLGNGRLVLGDLGISKVLEGSMDFASTYLGTPYYMSPEIYKNKPYNHKSDIWALGCVLYEMTTLKHAFDAQNLNGLACKIIKGKYPPVDPKYSKHLRDLIAEMLSTSPATRPDLPVILTKPFIKHHIKNFFADVASRPEESMGEGTLVMHSAASNIAAERSGMKPTHASTPEMESLVNQLHTLKLDNVMSAALGQNSSNKLPMNSARGSVASNRNDNSSATRQARLKAKEQAGALRREEERRQAVAAALERLREDRVKRGNEALAIRKKQRERDSQRAGRYVPGQRGYERNRNNAANLPAANERGRQRPLAEPKVSAPKGGSRNREGANRDRRRVADLDGWEQRHLGGGGGGDNARDVPVGKPLQRRDRSSSHDNRSVSERDENSNQALGMLGNDRAVAEAAAEARQMERRERERQRERNMQLAEIEKLKEAKLELDRRDGERRARQDNINGQRKPRNIEMKEEGSPERIIVRDALPRTPVDHLHNPSTLRLDNPTLRRAEDNPTLRRQQDGTIMVNTRQQQSTLLFPNTLEYQQTQLREQPTDRYSGNTLQQQTLVEESKLTSNYGNTSSVNGGGGSNNAAPGSLMNARERMLARKAERADELREARMQELRESNMTQANARAQAKDQERRMYSSVLDPGVPNQQQGMVNGHRQRESKDSEVAEAKLSMRSDSNSNDPLMGIGGMNAEELMAKLNEADGGNGKRFEVVQQDLGDRNGALDSPSSVNSSSSQVSDKRRGRERGLGDSGRGGNGGNVDISSDDLLGSSSDGSEFDSEDEGWARPEVREDGGDDAVEDIKKHEEELEAELKQCTLRVESLRKTLVQTKSMLKMKGNSPSAVVSPAGAVIGSDKDVGIDNIADVDVEDDEDDDEDDDLNDEEDDGVGSFDEGEEGEEEEEEEELRANSSLIREATGLGPQLKHLNIPPPKFPVTPKRKPSSGYRPSPELSDNPSPKGRLGDRISVLRQRCIEGLGQNKFDAAHGYLKQVQDAEEMGQEDDEGLQQRRLTSILGHDLVHYSTLIDQLIFMEDTLLDD